MKLEFAGRTHIHIQKERRTLLLRRFFSNRSVVVGAITLLIFALIAVFGPLLTSYGPLDVDPKDRLQPPSANHLFGTDQFGRDVFARVVYGTKVSMTVGFSVALLASLLGMIIGLLSAYYSFLDHLFMRICDGLFAFPPILLAIAMMVSLGSNIINVIISLSIVFLPSVARVVRSAALVVREQNYIEALHAQGASDWRIIWLHMAPNAVSPLIIQATYIFATSILTEASLSFLGAGIPAPAPSLGNILYDGKTVIFDAWWMTLFPGMFIMAMILALNLFGDGLRDLLDPHTKSW